jgi:acyl-CoA synthetase (AMP-forming)/AMP-acid ligase II
VADFTTFVDRFRSRVATFPGKPAAVFCRGSSGRDGEQTWSYAELDRAARQRRCGVLTNNVLLYPPGLDFLSTFLGCLYACVVAVPVPLPGAAGRQLERTVGIALDADATVVLTVSAQAETLRKQLTHSLSCGGPQVLASDDVPADAEAWTPPRLTSASIAVLQYTSGSTSHPKGVMVTHGNLVSNLDAIQRQSGTGADDVGVSWLPNFHDMGLFGMLHSLDIGATYVFMATAFLRRRSLAGTISRWRGAMCAAPTSYDLCARAVTAEQSAAWTYQAYGRS